MRREDRKLVFHTNRKNNRQKTTNKTKHRKEEEEITKKQQITKKIINKQNTWQEGWKLVCHTSRQNNKTVFGFQMCFFRHNMQNNTPRHWLWISFLFCHNNKTIEISLQFLVYNGKIIYILLHVIMNLNASFDLCIWFFQISQSEKRVGKTKVLGILDLITIMLGFSDASLDQNIRKHWKRLFSENHRKIIGPGGWAEIIAI